MLNQIIIVGRISNLKKDEHNHYIELKVPRSYKNENGEYEEDILSIKLFNNISDTVMEYCKNGDIVGVKGRAETGNVLVAEKVTFLSSKKEE